MNAPAPVSGPADADGFFWCSRCKAVVELSERVVETALSMPAGALVKLKCPGCHHHSVQWKKVTAVRPQHPDGRVIKPLPPPVDPERGRVWFESMRQNLQN